MSDRAAMADLAGHIPIQRMRLAASVQQPVRRDELTDLWLYETVAEARGENLLTDAGRITMITQMYGTSGVILTNGFNYIRLSADTFSEDNTSTDLSTVISTNGLAPAQASITYPTGSGNQITISYTWTATGTQAVKKACLATASSGGVIQHPIAFDSTLTPVNTQRLIVIYTLTESA